MPKARRRAKRLSMTSLIDVIFLLLLFFMLSSTFSRFAEVDLHAGGGAANAATPPETVVFLRLAGDAISVNGIPIGIADVRARLVAETPATLLVSVSKDVRAQALVNVLVAARGIEDLDLTVLEGS